MRFVIFSDIHGNYYALKESLKYIEKKDIDAIIWCGDYITDFSGGHEVIEMIQKYSERYDSYIILGNRDKKMIDYIDGKSFNIKEKGNYQYVFETLTKKDIEWLKSLPEVLEIELDTKDKIYVSHKYTSEKIYNCKYMIFGHDHAQCNFTEEGVRYINPGSVGIPTDGNIGAQFAILEITDKYEKIESILIKYDHTLLFQDLRNSKIYCDDIKWGKLLEKELKIGEDCCFKCLEEYNKIRSKLHLAEESLDVWNEAVDKILSQDS